MYIYKKKYIYIKLHQDIIDIHIYMICVFIYLSIYLFMYLFIYLFICLFIYSHTHISNYVYSNIIYAHMYIFSFNVYTRRIHCV